jgi:hypothetical protein
LVATEAVLAALFLSACAARQEGAAPSSVRASQPGMPCAPAVRVARAALLRLGYTVVSAEGASAGHPGKVVARKSTGWSGPDPQAGEQYTATVIVSCSDSGSELEASTDEPWLGGVRFRSDFPRTVDELAERRPARPSTDAPASGLVVSVEPLRSSEAVSEFGVDLPAAGISAVRLRIDNRTERTYVFRSSAVRLTSEAGTSAEPLGTDEVAPALTEQLAAKRIADGDIGPGQTLSGFLFFRASAYKRASVGLTDRETDETEGLSIEF